MLPLLRMLELKNLSMSDAEAGGFDKLAEAAKRCARCTDAMACIRWLKWHGRYGPAPLCVNVAYFDALRARARPG